MSERPFVLRVGKNDVDELLHAGLPHVGSAFGRGRGQSGRSPIFLSSQRGAARRWPQQLLGYVVFVLFMIYVAWHAHNGDRGLLAIQQKEIQLVEAREALKQAELAVKDIERKVNGLRGRLLDADLLDERARAALGLSRKEDIILLYEKPMKR